MPTSQAPPKSLGPDDTSYTARIVTEADEAAPPGQHQEALADVRGPVLYLRRCLPYRDEFRERRQVLRKISGPSAREQLLQTTGESSKTELMREWTDERKLLHLVEQGPLPRPIRAQGAAGLPVALPKGRLRSHSTQLRSTAPTQPVAVSYLPLRPTAMHRNFRSYANAPTSPRMLWAPPVRRFHSGLP